MFTPQQMQDGLDSAGRCTLVNDLAVLGALLALVNCNWDGTQLSTILVECCYNHAADEWFLHCTNLHDDIDVSR